jgi:hypothetical protein
MFKKSFFFSAIISFFCSFSLNAQTFTPDMDPDTAVVVVMETDTATIITFEEIFKKIVNCDGRHLGAMYITTEKAEIVIAWNPKKITEDIYLKNGDIIITTITQETISRRIKLQTDSEPKEDINFTTKKQIDSMKRISKNFTCVPSKE